MKRPVFRLIAAMTLDGKIAKHSHHMADWSSKEDKGFLHRMLDKADVAIVGNNTFETAKKPLSKRNCIVFTRSVKNPEQRGENLVFVNPAITGIAEFCRRHSYNKIAVLGGAKAFGYFLAHGLADEIFLTIEPLVFGAGIPLLDSGDYEISFSLVSVRKLNKKGSLLLHYRKR